LIIDKNFNTADELSATSRKTSFPTFTVTAALLLFWFLGKTLNGKTTKQGDYQVV
jgi:hypothetical protein